MNLSEIKAREKAASPGLWYAKVCSYAGDGEACGITTTPGEPDPWKQYNIVRDTCREECNHMMTIEDAAFVAHSRADIPALIARVEALEAGIRQVQILLDKCDFISEPQMVSVLLEKIIRRDGSLTEIPK